MDFFIFYLAIINVTGFVVMLVDKQKAIRGTWRIPEKVLLSVAVSGGSLGCLCGMYTFRHKTKHPKFTVGIPVILALQLAALSYFFPQ